MKTQLRQNRKKLVKEEVNIANMPLPLVIKHRKGIEDKANKYKGLSKSLFYCNEVKMEGKMLREIANDAITPKKTNKKVQNDLYERVEDADFYEGLDYDDQIIPSAEF